MSFVEFPDGRIQTLIPLAVKPAHQSAPTITGSAISNEAGTVLYGHFSMDYRLPAGDFLRLLAKHDKSQVQLLLLTHDAEKLRRLPGKRHSSLVANVIARLEGYRLRSAHYSHPLSQEQEAKAHIAGDCLKKLQDLLAEERALSTKDWPSQERLRQKILQILDEARGSNRLVATNPLVSEGKLGQILYEASQFAQHYQFNRVYPTSRKDQLDFSDYSAVQHDQAPYFVWDSELHLGEDEESLFDALRVLCQLYDLPPGAILSNIPANRFQRLEQFLHKLWANAQDWVNHLSQPKQASQFSKSKSRLNGLTITKTQPYYHLQGLIQTGYTSLEEMLRAISGANLSKLTANSTQEAISLLNTRQNGSWVQLANQQLIIVRLHNEMHYYSYFEENGFYFPLPTGDDLFTLSQLSKQHLYLPERASLRLKAFFSRLPTFFSQLYRQLASYVSQDLRQEFFKHIHSNHQALEEPAEPTSPQITKPSFLSSLEEVLRNESLLSNNQSLEEFIQTQIANSHYVIVREEHPQSPPPYDNPLHRLLGVARHIVGFFIDTNQKNPIVGTLAMAAYAYGAGAILAPEVLSKLLTKLHLEGLIAGIEPTQTLGKWMSHGTTPEALSAAITYWQSTVVGGNLDQFFIRAAKILKDDPAEVAIIAALALSLGYGLCAAIPPLQKEMGRFPYTNYAALGAKGGAAIYDTLMHPGEDWLLGSIKWFLRGWLTLAKLILAPFIEAYHYGYRQGFRSGTSKSFSLLKLSGKQSLAAFADLGLALLSIPLIELTALFIHVPYQGLSKLLSKALASLGNWQALGEALIAFASRRNSRNYLPGFRISPLYGFHSPFGSYAQNRLANLFLNALSLLISLPLALTKNLLVLPFLDLASFSLRLSLGLLNPLSRMTAYLLGTVLTTTAPIWDNSLGFLLQLTAKGLTLSTNWLERFTSGFKQVIVSKIQILRQQLYDWAFGHEDSATHRVNQDKDYFLDKPMRLEHLPHSSTQCLLEILLDNRFASTPERPLSNQQQHDLFHRPRVELPLQPPAHNNPSP